MPKAPSRPGETPRHEAAHRVPGGEPRKHPVARSDRPPEEEPQDVVQQGVYGTIQASWGRVRMPAWVAATRPSASRTTVVGRMETP